MDKEQKDEPTLLFATQALWEAWLEEHHTQPHGIWLQIAKKGSGQASVSYAEALESALCYGWIDGQKRSYDAQFFLQKFTPRRARSIWSKVNTEKATQLIATGRMQAAGHKEVEAARQDGRWDAAYASQSNAVMPEDFQTALAAHPEAKAFFETLDKLNRYAIYFRIQNTKTPEKRQAKIEQFIAMLAEQKKIYP